MATAPLTHRPTTMAATPVNYQLPTQPQPPSNEGVANEDVPNLSTIAILRRHPMYDSLVLVKKYRPCLGGYSLEFPSSFLDTAATTTPSDKNQNNQQERMPTNNKPKIALATTAIANTTNATTTNGNECILGKAHDIGGRRTKLVSVYLDGDDPISKHKLKQQNGTEQCNNGEVVYVPINGLLHRLNNYDKQGISIDSRVYAFAMGLKTAERFLTSSTEKEVQEAPPL